MRVQDLEGNRLFGDKSALRFSAVPEPGYCPATSYLKPATLSCQDSVGLDDIDVFTLVAKSGVSLVIIASALATISATGSPNAFAQRASVAKEIPSLPFSRREIYVGWSPARWDTSHWDNFLCRLSFSRTSASAVVHLDRCFRSEARDELNTSIL